MIRITNIKIYKNISDEDVFNTVIKNNKISKSDVLEWHISKKSIDARKKNDVHYNYSIDIKLKNEHLYQKFEKVKIAKLPEIHIKEIIKKRPIIVGAGPSGLFAALTLIENGIKPIIIEKGEPVEKRAITVNNFLKTGNLNFFSNVQLGEGGAGTFSDGKLTTGINSPFCRTVLKQFVKFGAPEQILYLSKPHIGTDKLINIIKNIRNYILSNGGIFYFNTKMENIKLENNKLKSIVCMNLNDKTEQEFNTEYLILAIGHSSRDTFKLLNSNGFLMERKNFSVGLRIEHLQKDINLAQYGSITDIELPPAEYKLAYHSPTGRSCYTFCMCPGGVVMASSSEEKTIVTNGMSNFLRNGENSNSAILVNVVPNDFKDTSVLSGFEFQKELEHKAFILGGSNYYAPIQRTQDFLDNKKSEFIGKIKPTYTPGVTLSNLNEILPEFVSSTLKEGIQYFDTKLNGFANPDSILTGIETRSSSPVRILRNDIFCSNVLGVYPCGEGAGYAGGIMSAAVDGIKCAIAILQD